MSAFQVARLEEIDELNDGRQPWRPIRHHLGITSFGINSWTGHEAGDRIINEHDEADDGNEELYVVLRGRASFEIDGERLDAPAGTLVLVQPEARRTAFAEEPETTLLAIGGTRGKAYVVSGWEVWAPIRPLYEAGDYAAAADRTKELLEREQRYPGLLYNLACCESLAGRTADAIEHLRQAIEAWEDSRSYAKGDSDFDPIREEPAFKELVGA